MSLKERVEVLEALLRKKRRQKLYSYRPYPKQFQFHEAGAHYRERLLMAGNQSGKTYSASMEVAMHLTGKYPDWWNGKRFEHPVLCWTGSPTNETSKSIIQKALLGTSEPDIGSQDMGTGSIPGDLISNVTTRQAGVKGVVDEILVKHVSGRNSCVSLKTYEQGRVVFQGRPVDVVWPDEEPENDVEIYSEMVTRTNQTGGLVMMTFTPLLGSTEIVDRFLSPKPGDIARSVTNMTLYDCVGGVWPEGTPWAGKEWKGHYTLERIKEIVASYEEYERDTRVMGVPAKGRGRVWKHPEKEISIEPFEIPRHFYRICGIDFGFDHPAAAVWLAHDRDTDVVYLYDCYRKSGQTALYHAGAVNQRDPQKFIPVAWPHDGLNTEKGTGIPLHNQYRKHGARMMIDSARYDDDIGGAQKVEPIVIEIDERIRTGRFRVFSHLADFFEEYRNYHRDEHGKIVPVKDDILSALRAGMIMLRYARRPVSVVPKIRRYTSPILGAHG